MRERHAVSATQLAEMGYCEHRILLADRLGDRVTPEQRRARVRGTVAHRRFLAEGQASRDRCCFIASCVFGHDALETRALRHYRDTVLMPRWWGRASVAVYYRIAPACCLLLERCPLGRRIARAWLRSFVAMSSTDAPA